MDKSVGGPAGSQASHEGHPILAQETALAFLSLDITSYMASGTSPGNANRDRTLALEPRGPGAFALLFPAYLFPKLLL